VLTSKQLMYSDCLPFPFWENLTRAFRIAIIAPQDMHNQTVTTSAERVKKNTKRNPVRTRARLLAAGVKLFSSRGYDGVSVEKIVNSAQVNKRMLYHYFGSKDGLYVEVLRVVFAELVELEMGVLGEDVPTAEAIRNILERYLAFLESHVEFVNLLLWENLHSGRVLDAHPMLLTKSPVVKELQAVVARAVERGEMKQAVDARHLLVLLYGACFMYHSNRYTLPHTVGLDVSRPAVLRDGLKLAQEVLLYGLLAR